MQGRVISEFMKFVCKKESVVTSQVYLELCEIKRYYDIAYSFNSTLNKICITAKKIKSGPTCVFIPITISEELNFLKIHKIVRNLPYELIYIVIVQADSTTVYYQIAENLLEPSDTTAKHLKENTQEKIDRDLKKNRELLEHGALLGLKVTLK